MGDRPVFEEVADAVRGMVPRQLGPVHCTYHRYGVKVWVGSGSPPREHYEAQVVGRQYAPEAEVLAVEVGFHAEHPKEVDNEAVIDRLLQSERAWRRTLGGDVVVGPFLGRAGHWRRVSELWLDPDLGDPELVFQLGARLAEYVAALEHVRTTGPR